MFNYNLNPKLSTEVCLTNYRIRVKNCAGVYHGWSNNKIILDVWYQLRKVKWCKKWGWAPYVSSYIFTLKNYYILTFLKQPCGISWGSRKRWNALSRSWNLRSGPWRPLFQKCDASFNCHNVASLQGELNSLHPSLGSSQISNARG